MLHELTQRGVDHALALDAALACKGGTFDAQREVAFARGIVSAVAAMSLAVVDEFDARWRKRLIEPPEHLSCDGAGFLVVHGPYIGEFDGVEAIKDARAC